MVFARIGNGLCFCHLKLHLHSVLSHSKWDLVGHVAITPYSIGGFHRLARTFFTGSLVLFHGSHFSLMDEPVNLLVGEKTTGSHRSKQKNKSAQSAGPTFSQHFSTQVSPHYIYLDPIYYVA